MLAELVAKLLSATEMMRIVTSWGTTLGIIITRGVRDRSMLIPLAKRGQMHGAFMICTEIYASGAAIGMIILTTEEVNLAIRKDHPQVHSMPSEGDAGTLRPDYAALHTVLAMAQKSKSSFWAFVLC